MQTQQTPQVLQQPFAAQGDKNTIPNAATGTNKASLQEGFPPITGQPINQGGIPPERADFNGAMNLNSQFYFAFQNGWLPTFSQEVSDAIGGYPQGAVLWYQSSEGLQILESAIPDNTNNFITNPSVIGTAWTVVGVTQASVQQAIPAYFYTQISNCLTKIPQDIKLALVDGVLTLKAGSKIYFPDGSAQTVTSDTTISNLGAANEKKFVFINTVSAIYFTTNCYSGSSQPSGGTYYEGDMWFDTENQTIKRYDGSNWTGNYSFPICTCKVTDGGVISAIDQVFNGFGYIGQTLFALPGVEGLSPDGRNADGSLKNELMTLDHVVTRDCTWNCAEGQYVFLGISQEYGDYLALITTTSLRTYKQQSTPPDLEKYTTWHRLDENKLYRTEDLSVTPNWVPMRGFAVGPVFNTGEGTNVSSWNIARPVAAVDMSNTCYISKQSMPSRKNVDLTLGASGTYYIAPANGFVHVSKNATASGQYLYIYLPDSMIGVGSFASGSNQKLELMCPVKAGEQFQISYSVVGTTQRFIFCFTEGDK